MGTNVLIIGASGDIGKQIAIQLGHEGYSLILHYYQNKTAIEAIQRELPREGILDTIKADLTNQAGINRLLAGVAYPVDSIVFASGIAYYGLFQETPEQIMEEMLSIHVKAPLLISKEALPSMIKKKSGNIILISSVWGEIGASYEVLYSAVKGSQISFVKALAKEVGPSGIRVNAVSPGFIDTKMNPLSSDEKEQIVSEIPLNRPGTPQDVANVVSFLLSEKAGYIHGEVLRVTGGWV
ncbi:elongation factor P 5-aminopentanone reductase [Ornithinibacillus californiensis]|uniref:elongation factor P 5-aminopentanone reductase n=1 Tax=Ornithinibacillus californiensis TaxID=161536 RepID=UPI00064DAE25|nr:SDR family oxidoreductase [Ornithinibacillus californiensis]